MFPKLNISFSGIAFQAHSPLGTPTRPPHYAKPNDPVVMEDSVVVDIAKKHNVHPALVSAGTLAQSLLGCL